MILYNTTSNHAPHTSPISIEIARFPDDLARVRSLFKEYAASIGVDLCFQKFDEELATLPGKYASPKGQILIAYVDGAPSGCVALRPLGGQNICEMKRLYVKPIYRGHHLGRKLAERIIQVARDKKYYSIRLDTLSAMREATQLYKRLGFLEIPAYYLNPEPEPKFFELAL